MLREQSVKIRTKLKIVKGRPDLTPLVDVFFLMLVFFMLSSSFVQLSGIKVSLPTTSEVNTGAVGKLVVTVDQQGKVFFQDLPIPNWDELRIKFDEARDSYGADTIIIRADEGSPFGTVARLMALAEERHLSAFIATVQDKEKEPPVESSERE